MPIGIDPKVDYAFKRVFGSPDHTAVTIHFLNAVLCFEHPITAVKILNPIHDKDHADDKISILDVLAEDSLGRRYNIEMQTTLPNGLEQRLTYYNCLNYTQQLTSGERYDRLRPAISICVLDRTLFQGVPEYHLSFSLRCDQHQELVLNSDIGFHLLELPKFAVADNNMSGASPLEKWLFFLKFADRLEPTELLAQLGENAYREATGVLEMISQTPEDREYYESRRKIINSVDYQLAIARQIAFEEGRQLGATIGRIQLLQELAGDSVSTIEELADKPADELDRMFTELQQRLRSRGDQE